MKPREQVLNVSSTLQGETVAMTIDASALANVMQILTDLYSDPELAVIREYSTNALDSHVEAGQTRPIEVDTPTALSPYLRIRDFGMGLDADDIREIYSRYGTSTKRDSDDVVGMLGLGCKSALTYTDQFTLTAVKDGNAIQVAISRTANGGGEMMIVNEYDTDEHNGVEIEIPVKKYNELEEKAKHFFSFWKPGTVLLNGAEPKLVEGFRLSDDLLIMKNHQTSYIVMGNVPYPVSTYYNWKDGLNWQYGRVAWVEIGDVHFTPSREALQDTPETKATLERVSERFATERDVAVQRLIDLAPSKPEALTLLGELRAAWGFRNDPTYKGEEIPSSVEAPKVTVKDSAGNDKEVPAYSFVIGNGRTGYGNNRTEKRNSFATSLLATSVFLTGFSSEDLTPYKKKKLVQWQSKQGFTVTPKQYILCPSVPADFLEWIDPSTIMDWADVEAEKIVNPYKAAAGSTGKLVGTFIGWINGEYNEEIDINEIDTKKPILFIEGTKARVEELSGRYDSTLPMLLAAAPKGYTLLIVGKNRVEKLKRDLPKVQTVHEFIKVSAKKWADNLTADEKQIIRYRESVGFKKLHLLDADKVNDTELGKLIRLAKQRSDALITNFNRFSRYAAVDFKGLSENPAVIKNYPLLTQVATYGTLDAESKNHLHLYINAVHAAKEEV